METVVLRADCSPVLRDLLEMAPWPVWRCCLRLWQHVAGRDPGTLCGSAPEVLSLRDWDMCAPGTPAIFILDKLVSDGWRVGKPPSAHALDTPRIFSRPGKMVQHSYWRCLATLDKLYAKCSK